MSVSTFTIVHCDRCKAEVTVEREADRAAWGRIRAQQVDGKSHIGPDAATGYDDLCAVCFLALIAWYDAVAEPMEQPPPPLPPLQPAFTLEDRARVIDAADSMIRALIDGAIGVVREAPTMLLTGDTIDGAYALVGAGAKALVDDIVARLGIRGARR